MSQELFFLTITNILLMQVKFQKCLKIFIIKIRGINLPMKNILPVVKTYCTMVSRVCLCIRN